MTAQACTRGHTRRWQGCIHFGVARALWGGEHIVVVHL